MAGQDIEDLDVFKRAYAISLEIHEVSHSWPRHEQFGGIADQIRRSSKSVCALLVEGGARRQGSLQEFRRYVLMALSSADETRLWCQYAVDLSYIEPALHAQWTGEIRHVARMLQGLLKSKAQR